MRAERLFEIVFILLNRKQTTAQELAKKFGVSMRTIYCDLDILSTAGIPVYTVQGIKPPFCLHRITGKLILK